MEEAEEQKLMCKFCDKVCLSGRSLGGHMRGHLDLIAAAKKQKTKADQNSDPQEARKSYRKDCSVSVQSNCAKIGEKGKNMILGEASYGLRENPNKSLKIFYSKHSGLKRENLCRESGKRFPLADHQMSHSRKGYEEENHLCKKCGKVFDSIRALYGHMKIHSKRSRLDMENQCSVRKKRSPIRYKITANSPFSQSELEEAAVCLMMLSRGVTSWNEFVSASGTLIFETQTIYCDQEISSKYVSSTNLPEIASGVVDGNEKNAASQISVDRYDSIDQFKKPKRHEEFAGKLCLELENSVMQTKDSSHRKKMAPFSEVDSTSDFKRLKCNATQSKMATVGMEVESSQFSISKDHECPVCFKVFTSGKGLGGHKRVHYINAIQSKKKDKLSSANNIVNLSAGDAMKLKQWWTRSSHDVKVD